MVEVIALDEFTTWFDSLSDDDMSSVVRVVDLLEARGVALGFPHSSALKGTSAALRELRVQSMGRPIRIIYAFDPKRQAILILGADKTGDENFYAREIPKAERLWCDYLEENS